MAVQTASSQPELILVRTTDLRRDTHHVQGIDFDERRVWVTSVDKTSRQGYLQEFALDTGEGLRSIDVTRGDRFHPGGISVEGKSLWIPVAEYRRDSSSVIQKRSLLTLEVESEFEVADHIGCLAAGSGVLVGANWDSRAFYMYTSEGMAIRGNRIHLLPEDAPSRLFEFRFVAPAVQGKH